MAVASLRASRCSAAVGSVAAAQGVVDELSDGKVGVERHVWADKRETAGNDYGCFGSSEGGMDV